MSPPVLAVAGRCWGCAQVEGHRGLAMRCPPGALAMPAALRRRHWRRRPACAERDRGSQTVRAALLASAHALRVTQGTRLSRGTGCPAVVRGHLIILLAAELQPHRGRSGRPPHGMIMLCHAHENEPRGSFHYSAYHGAAQTARGAPLPCRYAAGKTCSHGQCFSCAAPSAVGVMTGPAAVPTRKLFQADCLDGNAVEAGRFECWMAKALAYEKLLHRMMCGNVWCWRSLRSAVGHCRIHGTGLFAAV